MRAIPTASSEFLSSISESSIALTKTSSTSEIPAVQEEVGSFGDIPPPPPPPKFGQYNYSGGYKVASTGQSKKICNSQPEISKDAIIMGGLSNKLKNAIKKVEALNKLATKAIDDILNGKDISGNAGELVKINADLEKINKGIEDSIKESKLSKFSAEKISESTAALQESILKVKEISADSRIDGALKTFKIENLKKEISDVNVSALQGFIKQVEADINKLESAHRNLEDIKAKLKAQDEGQIVQAGKKVFFKYQVNTATTQYMMELNNLKHKINSKIEILNKASKANNDLNNENVYDLNHLVEDIVKYNKEASDLLNGVILKYPKITIVTQTTAVKSTDQNAQKAPTEGSTKSIEVHQKLANLQKKVIKESPEQELARAIAKRDEARKKAEAENKVVGQEAFAKLEKEKVIEENELTKALKKAYSTNKESVLEKAALELDRALAQKALERLEAEKLEAARLEAEKLEKARIEAEKFEPETVETINASMVPTDSLGSSIPEAPSMDTLEPMVTMVPSMDSSGSTIPTPPPPPPVIQISKAEVPLKPLNGGGLLGQIRSGHELKKVIKPEVKPELEKEGGLAKIFMAAGNVFNKSKSEDDSDDSEWDDEDDKEKTTKTKTPEEIANEEMVEAKILEAKKALEAKQAEENQRVHDEAEKLLKAEKLAQKKIVDEKHAIVKAKIEKAANKVGPKLTLLEQIQAGTKLKKIVEIEETPKVPVKNDNSLLTLLSDTLKANREAIDNDDDIDVVGGDSDWD